MNKIDRLLHGWLRRFFREQRGALLLETVLVIFIFGMVGVAVLAGLSTASISKGKTEVQSNIEDIARNQMEYLLSLPYQDPPTSCSTISVPQGFSVTCEAEEYVVGDTNIEKPVVTVTFGATQVVLETLRTK